MSWMSNEASTVTVIKPQVMVIRLEVTAVIPWIGMPILHAGTLPFRRTEDFPVAFLAFS